MGRNEFRIRSRGKTHRINVRVHATLGEMREASEWSKKDTQVYGAYRPDGRTRSGGARGTIHLSRGYTRMCHVAHEVTHAVWDMAEAQFGGIALAEEEWFAYQIDRLMDDLWRWLMRLLPPGGVDEEIPRRRRARPAA